MGAPKYQLEDILNKKKPPPSILDMHNVKIENEEDFKKAVEKIPDYKVKAEKKEVTMETLSHQENNGIEMTKFPEDQKNQSQDLLINPPEYDFANPCPLSMRQVRISDLSSVDINWRMLTLARPESKIEEEIFSKLVHLDKLRLATRREESEILFDAGGKDPDIIVKAASESKGGVIEKLIRTCPECGDEFCYGACV